MNKKYIIIALMALFGLWNDSDAMQQQRGVEGLFEAYPYNEPQEQYMEPQPRFQQIYPEVYRPTAPVASQYKTTRKQPAEMTDIGGYEEPEMSTEERMPEVPALTLKQIANATVALWNVYKNAKRTTNNRFSNEDWKKIDSKIDALQLAIQDSRSDILKNYFHDSFEENILKSTELYDLSAFGQALNAILGMVNKTIEDNPNSYNARYIKLFSLNDIPLIVTEEPGAIFVAQQYVTAPISEAYDWTKGAIGGVVSTGWDWTKWGVGSIGSGLSGIKKWAAPISEAEKSTLEGRLKSMKLRIDQLKTKLSTTKKLSIADQQELEKLVKLASQYESKIRGWAPWLGAAALGAAAYGARAYLQSK